ncbi:hypothetical protein, partial [Rhizobium leguminosarum]|uniref:hypothetical protein n=1 Tax=Rhizobium leguminosarum TaxID=384 RepID=UPI003F947345
NTISATGQIVHRNTLCEINWNERTGYLNTLNSSFKSSIAWKAPAQIRTFLFISSSIDADGASAAYAFGS